VPDGKWFLEDGDPRDRIVTTSCEGAPADRRSREDGAPRHKRSDGKVGEDMGSFRVTREARSTPILWQLSSRKVSKSRRWIELEESGGEGGIATIVVEQEVRVGERQYVSSFQRRFPIRRNRHCLRGS